MSNLALTQEQIDHLGVLLNEHDDRYAFYQLYHDITGSERVLEMANISQFQGFEGAVAKHANELVEAKFPEQYPEGGVISFSKEIASNLYEAIVADFTSGSGTGVLSERTVLETARDTWDSHGLGDQFPGNTLLAAERVLDLDVIGAWEALASEGTSIAIESALYTAIPDIGPSESSSTDPNAVPWSESASTPADPVSGWGTHDPNPDTGWGSPAIIDHPGLIVDPTPPADPSWAVFQDTPPGEFFHDGSNPGPMGSAADIPGPDPDPGWSFGAEAEQSNSWGGDHSGATWGDQGGSTTDQTASSFDSAMDHSTESWGATATSASFHSDDSSQGMGSSGGSVTDSSSGSSSSSMEGND